MNWHWHIVIWTVFGILCITMMFYAPIATQKIDSAPVITIQKTFDP